MVYVKLGKINFSVVSLYIFDVLYKEQDRFLNPQASHGCKQASQASHHMGV